LVLAIAFRRFDRGDRWEPSRHDGLPVRTDPRNRPSAAETHRTRI